MIYDLACQRCRETYRITAKLLEWLHSLRINTSQNNASIQPMQTLNSALASAIADAFSPSFPGLCGAFLAPAFLLAAALLALALALLLSEGDDDTGLATTGVFAD